jgi:SAM-dependent methyltransferase
MPIPDHIIKFWEQRYLDENTPWDRGEVSPALRHWLATGALQVGRILVPGCGRGYEVVELAQRGFEVVGIDTAPAAVVSLERRLDEAQVTAEVICSDLLEWKPAREFDAIYEQTCLCAMAPSVWPDYSRLLGEWLRPGGSLYVLFMQTGQPGGPPYHCDVTTMHALFNDVHWHWESAPPVPVPHPSGIRELGYVLQRRTS